ncbi:hypothetical protein ACJ41O_000008 [Fusarium nematophilum]
MRLLFIHAYYWGAYSARTPEILIKMIMIRQSMLKEVFYSARDTTASVTSSVFTYRTVNGRKFQVSKTTEYWAPLDERNQEAFDVAHQFTIMLFDDKLFCAPIKANPQNILDVGTGTGIWAMQAADEFASASVIGTDISAIQPDWVPPNCSFQIDDAQEDWTFRTDFFDFIHMRYLYGAIQDWGRLYSQAFSHIKPGGYLEHIDLDLEARSQNQEVQEDDSHVFKRWKKLFYRSGDLTGRAFNFSVDGKNAAAMRAAGFVDVVHKQWQVPVGGWPRDPRLRHIGILSRHHVDLSISGLPIIPIGERLGWSVEELTVLTSQMREAFNDPKTRPYYIV